MLEAKEINNIGKWDSFIEESIQYNLFSTSSWASIIRDATNIQPKYYGFYNGNELIACMLLFYSKKIFYNIHAIPPLTPFASPIFLRSQEKRLSKIESYYNKVIDSIVNMLKKEFSYFSISLHPTINDFRPFSNFMLKPKLAYTYIIDLSDLNKTWQNMDKDTKYDIRKAGERGVKVSSQDNIEDFYSLYCDTCKRQNFPVLVNKKILKGIMKLKETKMFFADNGHGKKIATAVLVFDKNTAYYLMAAYDNNFKDYKAASYLLWEIIRYSSEKRKRIDLVGANIPEVAKFKSGFNPALVPYIQTEGYSSYMVQIPIELFKKIMS